MIGTWEVDNQSFADILQKAGELEGVDIGLQSVTGTATAVFAADGTGSTTYKNWTITMAMEGNEAVIEREGTDLINWSVSGDTLSIEEDELASKVTMTLGGMVMEAPDSEVAIETGTFSCEGNTLKITGEEGYATVAHRKN